MSSSFTRAGTILEHRNFRSYIKELDIIEKKQQQAFSDKPFRQAAQGFDRAERQARDYERQLQRTAKAQSALASGIGGFATGFLSRATLQAIADSAQAAAAFKGQQQALQNLAGSYGQSGPEITRAIARAADGVLSQTQTMNAALEGTQLQAARTPEEFERLTGALVRIGQARGIGSAEAIERGFAGIGKREVGVLNELGITTRSINAEMEILAQRDFGRPVAGLSAAQREALFVEAAIAAAEAEAARFGDSSGEAVANFEKINAEMENLKLVFGAAVLPEVSQFASILDDVLITAQQALAIIAGGIGAAKSLMGELGGGEDIFTRLQKFAGGELRLDELLIGIDVTKIDDLLADIPGAIERATAAGNERFKDIAETMGVVFPDSAQAATEAIEEVSAAAEESENQIRALQAAVRQAENIELSFARATEDAARKLARSQEKLGRDQAKAREKLLIGQQKQLDEFEAGRLEELAEFEEDRIKQIANAEKDIAKEEQRAQREQQREFEQFHRQMRQAEERFNLDRIQSQRRFNLDETRLRAEGDILGLQRLREDFDLSRQESAENFDLQQRQAEENQEFQTKGQAEEQENRLAELRQHLAEQRIELESSLEEQRAAQLANFDEQLLNLEESQREQREALLENFAESEQDRMLNYQRQIEDLGRSLVEQEDMTKAGAAAIAQQLEEAFGKEGVADQIMTGFTQRQESAFQKLFESIAEGAKTAQERLEELAGTGGTGGVFGATGFDRPAATPQRVAGFQHGGSFTVGGTGGPDSQLVAFRGTPGERVTVTPQQQTFRMPIAAPGGNVLDVRMSGGFDLRGAEAARQEIVEASLREMTEAVKIAVLRRTRR